MEKEAIMLCEEVIPVLPLLPGCEDAAREAALQAHLLCCSVCQDLQASFEADEQALHAYREAIVQEPLSLNFADAVMRRVGAEERLPPQQAPILQAPFLSHAWLVAALLLLGLGLSLSLGLPGSSPEEGERLVAPAAPGQKPATLAASEAPLPVIAPRRVLPLDRTPSPRRLRRGSVVPVGSERSGNRELRGRHFMRQLQQMMNPAGSPWGEESRLPPLDAGARELRF